MTAGTPRWLAVAALAAGALTLTACSSSPAGAPDTSAAAPAPVQDPGGASSLPAKPPVAVPPAPCTLAGKAEVATAFGGTVTDGVLEKQGDRDACLFDVTGGNIGPSGSVVVGVRQGDTERTIGISQQQSQGASPVDGLGDVAFYVPATKTVTVLKGVNTITLQVIYNNADAGKVQTDALKLAPTVVGHAP